MVAARRSSVLAVMVAAGTLAAGTLAAGCGSGGVGKTAVKAGSHPANAAARVDPAAVRVIREWSDALRRGDVGGAARYFALPSAFVNGVAITIRSAREAVAVNASLPCGAVLISADRRGRYVNALFRLTDRPGPGGGCGAGVGQLARTNFVIAAGRIVEWLRAPESPGGGSGPGAPPTPSPPAPSLPAPSAPPASPGASPQI